MPRFVTVPDEVQLIDPESGQVLSQRAATFADWLGSGTILDNPRHFGKGGVGALRAVVRIERAFNGKCAGDVAILDESDWTLLVAACKDPGDERSFSRPRIAAQLLAFYDALIDAPDSDPREVSEAA